MLRDTNQHIGCEFFLEPLFPVAVWGGDTLPEGLQISQIFGDFVWRKFNEVLPSRMALHTQCAPPPISSPLLDSMAKLKQLHCAPCRGRTATYQVAIYCNALVTRTIQLRNPTREFWWRMVCHLVIPTNCQRWNFPSPVKVPQNAMVSVIMFPHESSSFTALTHLWKNPTICIYICVCMYVCIYIYVCMYVYVCICMYMYVYVCICMYMYVYVCICMYACIVM